VRVTRAANGLPACVSAAAGALAGVLVADLARRAGRPRQVVPADGSLTPAMMHRRSTLALALTFAATTACRRASHNTAPPPATPAPSVTMPATASVPAVPSTPTAAPVPAVPTAPQAGAPGTPTPAAPAAPAVPAAPAPATPAGTPVSPTQLAPQTQTASGLRLTATNPVLFRWEDGDWVFRVTYAIQNTGTTPVDFDRVSLRLADWSAWGGDTTLEGHSSVNPGLTITGDAAWYIGGGNPQPTSLSVRYAPGDDDSAPVLATFAFTPVFSPAPPAHGAAPNAVVYSLPVNVAQPGLTFVHTDGDRSVRLSITIANNTGAALRVPLSYLHAKIGETEGSHWSPLTTFADPIEVPAGGTASGTAGWYWSGDPGVPPAVNFTFGPLNSPQVNSQVTVAPGADPVP
jgi:hypothetical protein